LSGPQDEIFLLSLSPWTRDVGSGRGSDVTELCTKGRSEQRAVNSRSWVQSANPDAAASADIVSSCGWGSASIYLAELFPKSSITAFSNSRTQRAYIEGQAKAKGLTNLTVTTGDVVEHEFEANSFDRVISIELFEHMKNYKLLMAKVSRALRPQGKLFVHIFAHAESPYDFEDGWMSTHFFTGGTMPSADLLHFFQDDLVLNQQWWVSGKHYAHTCEDWLKKMNASKKKIWPHLEETYGKEKTAMWFYRWQIFYMACAELFAWEGGDTWGVCHYLFEKR
jgi:cation-transporting P-type ATPase 13A2